MKRRTAAEELAAPGCAEAVEAGLCRFPSHAAGESPHLLRNRSRGPAGEQQHLRRALAGLDFIDREIAARLVRTTRAKWREAAERAQQYVAKNPQSGRGWYNLGFASLAGDRPEASIDASSPGSR